MRIDNLIRIADYYGVSTDFLLGLTNQQNPIMSDTDKTKGIIMDYIGLSEKSIDILNENKIDFSIIAPLDFLLSNSDMINALCECLVSNDNLDTYSLIEKLNVLKIDFQKYLEVNPALKEKIKFIHDLKHTDIRRIADYAYCPARCSSLHELIKFTKEEFEPYLDNISDDPDYDTEDIAFDDQGNIIERSNSQDLRDYLNEAYKCEIGRRIVDKALLNGDS